MQGTFHLGMHIYQRERQEPNSSLEELFHVRIASILICVCKPSPENAFSQENRSSLSCDMRVLLLTRKQEHQESN